MPAQDEEAHLSESNLKGIPAQIEPAPKEKVFSLPELLKEHYRKE